MRGVNKVIIVGNMGADPEISYTPSGTAVAKFSVATSESWTDKNTGAKQERVEWHRITFFNKTAENIGQYCAKGSQVYIEGQLRTDKYQDKKTGEDRYSTGILGRLIQFLGGGNNSGHNRNNQSANYTTTAPAGAEFDDDIPF